MSPVRQAPSPPSGPLQGLFPDYGELGRLGGWDLAFKQLDSGPPTIPASVVVGGRLSVMSLEFNCGFHQTGWPPAGTVTVGLPEEGLQSWFGRPYQDQSVLPFNHASGVDGVSRRGFRAFTLSIDEKLIEEISSALQLAIPEHLFAPEPGSFIPDSAAVQRLRQGIRRLLTDEETRFGPADEEVLVVELLTASADGDIEDESAPAARARAVSKVLEFFEEHRFNATTVAEACAATGVAWRTLNRGFLERFGIGPKAYLERLKLSGVRDELSVSPPRTLVADVANAWGFWHMGQFARDYRGLFGELPSRTLGRSETLVRPRVSAR
jgi:AraC-like DNA-binding protein